MLAPPKYRVLFQAYCDGLAVLAQTDDLEFARSVMLAAFRNFCTPGLRFQFLRDQPKEIPFAGPRGRPEKVLEHYELRSVVEPIVALYESVNGKWEWKESCGWTEEGAQD